MSFTKRVALAIVIALFTFAQANAQVYPPASGGGTTYTTASPVPATAGGLGPFASLPTPAPATRLVFEGDSIARGGGATTCPGAIFNTSSPASSNTGTCWTDKVSTFYNLPEFSLAVSGTCLEFTTTSGSPCAQSSTTNGSLINRYPTEAALLTATDTVYLQIGTNDVNAEYLYGDTQVNPVTFAANLVTVLNAYAAVVGASHIILGEITESAGTNARLTAAFNLQIDLIAVQYGYRLAATSYVIQSCAVQYPADGCINTSSAIHPDDQGHANMALAYEAANYGNAVSANAAGMLGAQGNLGNAGNSNTTIGYGSLLAATGGNDTCVGYKTCPVIVAGGSNTVVGSNAATALTGGNANTLVGTSAGAALTTTSSNAYVGSQAGITATGSSGTCLGATCLFSLSSGSTNTCVGFACLYGLTLQASNVALGYQAGRYITGGSTANNSSTGTYIGYNTQAFAAGDSNESVLGNAATGGGSNTVTLGNTSVTKVLSTGYVQPTNGFSDASTTCTGNSFCRAALTAGTYTWTFGHAWTNVPACIVTEESTTATHTASGVPTTTNVVVTSLTTTGNTDFVDIMCGGRNG